MRTRRTLGVIVSTFTTASGPSSKSKMQSSASASRPPRNPRQPHCLRYLTSTCSRRSSTSRSSTPNTTNGSTRKPTDSGKHDNKSDAADGSGWNPRKHYLCVHCGGRHFSDKCTDPRLKGTKSYLKEMLAPPERDDANANNVDLINKAFASWENAASDTRLDPLPLEILTRYPHHRSNDMTLTTDTVGLLVPATAYTPSLGRPLPSRFRLRVPDPQ